MINQFETPLYIEEALPAITAELKSDKATNVYGAIDALSAYTCKNIKTHNFQAVRNCFEVAEKLYTKGNTVVKDAVQNIFVYSFTKVFQQYAAEKHEVLAILPASLYALYMSQVHHRGC